MLNKWLLRLVDQCPARVIAIDGDPYLVRYYLGRLFGLTFYLHRFIRNDYERTVHDHPWRAIGLVLTGGYEELRLRWLCPQAGLVLRCRRVRRGIPNILLLRSAHRIVSVQPNTWTLFMHGRRRKSWGFFTPRTFAETRQCRPGVIQVLYSQHLDTGSGSEWHRRAPLGRELSL